MTIQINYQNSDLTFTENDTHTTPPSGTVRLYAKTDGFLYSKDDAGVETQLGGGGVTEPANQIVYGTGTGVDSAADFTYNNTNGAFFVNTTDGSTPAVSSATPGDIGLVGTTSTSRDVANAGGAGGFVRITSGDATYVAGGSIEITTPRGGNFGDGAGGEIYITGGDTADNITTAFPIIAVNNTTEIFTIAGDYTGIFGTGMSFIVTGSTGNDGTYSVSSSTFTGGNTEIEVNEDITDPTADGNITTVLITANSGSNIYLRAGHFNADYISGSGTAGNMFIAAGSAYNNNNGGANPGTVTIMGGGTAGDNNSISGGSVNITGGSTIDSTSSGVNGSNVNITGGNLSDTTSGGGSAGNVVISGGTLSSTGPGTAGSVIIQGGTATALGHGGSVEITGRDGVGANRNGGNVTITAGTPTGTGTAGQIRLNFPSTGDLRIDGDAGTAGQVLTSNGPNLPPTWETSGGVTEPANQIVYGTGTGVDSAADFTYDNTTGQFWLNTADGVTGLSATSPGTVTIFGVNRSGFGGGGAVNINAGDAGTDGSGAPVTIRGGDCITSGPFYSGGDVTLVGGSHPGGGQTGRVRLQGGTSTSGLGGLIIIYGGLGGGTGGLVQISGGNGNGIAANGGNASFRGGIGFTGSSGDQPGNGGNVFITGGLPGSDNTGLYGNGGSVSIAGANATSNDGGTGGDVFINGGAGKQGSGTIYISGGDTPGVGPLTTAGNIVIEGGRANQSTEVAGNVEIKGGDGTLGSGGSVIISTGIVTTNRLEIDYLGSWLLAGTAGTSGQVLTSNGSGTPPTWQTPSGASLQYYDEPVAAPAVAPNASGTDAIAIGDGAVSSNTNTLAFGTNSTAAAIDSVAIGNNATVNGTGTLDGSVAIGDGASVTAVDASNAVAIGTSAEAVQGSVAIGNTAVASPSVRSIAIGNAATATAGESIAIGDTAGATGTRSIAIGDTADAGSTDSIAIGTSASASGGSGGHAIAIGESATSSGSGTISIGDNAVAGGSFGIALGAVTAGSYRFALGMGGDLFTGGRYFKAATYAQTIDNTTTEMFLGNNIGQRLVLPDDTSWNFTIQLTARRTDANDESLMMRIEGGIDRNTGAATTALVAATLNTTIADDSGGAWVVAVDADTTNGALRIQVTGETAKTIRWVAYVDVVEVTG